MNKKVLYADDDQSGRDMMKMWIDCEELPIDLVMSGSVEESRELLSKQKFDLLLLDYWFPDGSGSDICRTARESWGDLPVLFYSGFGRTVDRDDATDAGSTAYFLKPNDLNQILPMIRYLLKLDSDHGPAFKKFRHRRAALGIV